MRLWRLALTCGEIRILLNRGFHHTFFTQHLKKRVYCIVASASLRIVRICPI